MELVINYLESENGRLTKEIFEYREYLKENLWDCERSITKRRMNVKIKNRRQIRKALKILKTEPKTGSKKKVCDYGFKSNKLCNFECCKLI